MLQPISIKYCRSIVDEYCKDSSSYLQRLQTWKETATDKNNEEATDYIITAADVKALYPSLDRGLIKLALTEAIMCCSDFKTNSRKILVELCLYCVENVLIQFQGNVFKQGTGIPTGENNSVSLANISLHYIVQRIPEITTCSYVFQRYIDDIIYISPNQRCSDIIKECLKSNLMILI